MLDTRVLNGNVDGRIRRAIRADIPAIARLMRRAQSEDAIPRISEVEIGELMTRGEIIVLGVEPDELVAAACLRTSGARGHLAFLVVDPHVVGLEARIRGVAAALSDSEGCEPTFDRSLRHVS